MAANLDPELLAALLAERERQPETFYKDKFGTVIRGDGAEAVLESLKFPANPIPGDRNDLPNLVEQALAGALPSPSGGGAAPATGPTARDSDRSGILDQLLNPDPVAPVNVPQVPELGISAGIGAAIMGGLGDNSFIDRLIQHNKERRAAEMEQGRQNQAASLETTRRKNSALRVALEEINREDAKEREAVRRAEDLAREDAELERQMKREEMLDKREQREADRRKRAADEAAANAKRRHEEVMSRLERQTKTGEANASTAAKNAETNRMRVEQEKKEERIETAKGIAGDLLVGADKEIQKLQSGEQTPEEFMKKVEVLIELEGISPEERKSIDLVIDTFYRHILDAKQKEIDDAKALAEEQERVRTEQQKKGIERLKERMKDVREGRAPGGIL